MARYRQLQNLTQQPVNRLRFELSVEQESC